MSGACHCIDVDDELYQKSVINDKKKADHQIRPGEQEANHPKERFTLTQDW